MATSARQVRWGAALWLLLGAGLLTAGALTLDAHPIFADIAICVGALLVLTSLIAMITAGSQAARLRRTELLRTGRPATASVLRLEDTGTTTNDNPEVIIHLLVAPLDGSPPFESRARQVVSRLEIPRPGWQTSVRYDPANPDVVAVSGAINGAI